jgi:hypothetical protein
MSVLTRRICFTAVSAIVVLRPRDGSRQITRCSAILGVAAVVGILTACAEWTVQTKDLTFVGSDHCNQCHENETRFWEYGPHRVVACEQCHGPGGRHESSDDHFRPKMSLGSVHLCLSCHGDSAGPSVNTVSRIGSFEDHLRSLEEEHRIKLDRKKSGTSCVFCHDPHLLE